MAKPKELKSEIKIEIKNLERLTNEMKQLLARTKELKSFMEVRAAGSILHDFYCGTEKIFERIAVAIDKSFPKGENWHTELLLQMAKPLERTRDRIISEGLIQKLKEFLRFRHLFRHIYGFELKWDRIRPLCVDVENVLNELRQEMNEFLNTLNKETGHNA